MKATGFGFNLSALVALQRSERLGSRDVTKILQRISDAPTKKLAREILARRKKNKTAPSAAQDAQIEIVSGLARLSKSRA